MKLLVTTHGLLWSLVPGTHQPHVRVCPQNKPVSISDSQMVSRVAWALVPHGWWFFLVTTILLSHWPST